MQINRHHVASAVNWLASVVLLASTSHAQPTGWLNRPSGTGASLLGGAYGPFSGTPIFVLGGQGGAVTLSEDGANWSATSLGGPTVFDVDSNGAGCFMLARGDGLINALGPCGGAAFPSSVLWSGVAYGNGIWSAVGGSFTIQTGWLDVFTRSTNGGSSWAPAQAFASGTLLTPLDVAFGGGAFVAGFGDGRLQRSTDGISFATTGTASAAIQALAHGNGVWIGVGSSGRIARSTNGGVTWSFSTVAGSPLLATIVFGGGYFVVGGQNGLILYSTNGSSWTSTPSGTGVLLEASAYGNNTWVLGGENGVIVQSSLLADLARTTPAGWSGSIVLSAQSGTSVDESLTTLDTPYLDTAWINSGRSASGGFFIRVFIDDIPYADFQSGGLGIGQAQGIVDLALPTLAVGEHTVSVVVDLTDSVAEADEGNNLFSKQFTIAPPPVCDGDADDDGVVTFADITSVLKNWSMIYTPDTGTGDANHDGNVNFADVTSVLTYFGVPCP